MPTLVKIGGKAALDVPMEPLWLPGNCAHEYDPAIVMPTIMAELRNLAVVICPPDITIYNPSVHGMHSDMA